MALGDAAERKIGRHLSCPATFDEQTMALLKQWRKEQSAEQKVPAFVVFTDATLIAIAEARPRTRADLIKVQGLGPTKAERYGDEVLAIVADEAARGGA
jgi:DNA helicase-2/ATP-dependent DNA helicase PcrA